MKILSDAELFELWFERKPTEIDLEIWTRYGDQPPKLRRITKVQVEAIRKEIKMIMDVNHRDPVALWERLKEYLATIE